MIGLSISLCIKSIAEGYVRIESVEKIVSSTMANTENDINVMIAGYRKAYWQKLPDRCEAIFRQMLAEHKIEQPRLTAINRHPVIEDGHIWVKNEGEIRWSCKESETKAWQRGRDDADKGLPPREGVELYLDGYASSDRQTCMRDPRKK